MNTESIQFASKKAYRLYQWEPVSIRRELFFYACI